MASRFESRFKDVAIPRLKEWFGVTVRFCRGPYVSDEFQCVRQDREYTVLDSEYGVQTQVVMRVFQPLSESLVIDGDAVEPRVGDRFIEGDEIYEIQPPGDDIPAVEERSGSFDWLCSTNRIE